MKRQRTYRDSANVEHNGEDYQNGYDNEMERRSEEDRLERRGFRPCDECRIPNHCVVFGCALKPDKPLKTK